MAFLDSIKNLFGKRPPTGEVGQARGQLSAWVQKWHAVSDDLIDKKGSALYKEMKHDPDVKSGLTVKTFGILARGWEINSAVEEGEDGYEAASEQAAFVQEAFDAMPGSLDDVLEEELRDALVLGTGIAEKVWEIRRSESLGRDAIAYKAIKPKDTDLYDFDMDEYNNLRGLALQPTGGAKMDVDPEKFVFLAYQPSHGEAWGLSDLRGAYRYYWAKKKVVEFWLIHMEKFGMPTAKGTYPQGMPKDKQDDLLTVLNKIQQETAIVVPESVTVELLEASSKTGKSDYLEALEWCSKQIVKAILGQTLATDEGSRTGSMALGKVHQDVLSLYIRKLKRLIEEYVDEQVIRPLVDYNFAERYYPNFTLLLDDKDVQMLSEVVFRLCQVDVIDAEIDNAWIREYLGIPARTKEQQAEIDKRRQEMEAALAPRTPGAEVGDDSRRANQAV